MIKIRKIYQDQPIKIDVITNAIIKKGFSPYIGENGNWYQYDNEKKEFFDTGIKAEGKDGKDGYTPIKGIDYFDGEKGEKGEPRKRWKRWNCFRRTN